MSKKPRSVSARILPSGTRDAERTDRSWPLLLFVLAIVCGIIAVAMSVHSGAGTKTAAQDRPSPATARTTHTAVQHKGAKQTVRRKAAKQTPKKTSTPGHASTPAATKVVAGTPYEHRLATAGHQRALIRKSLAAISAMQQKTVAQSGKPSGELNKLAAQLRSRDKKLAAQQTHLIAAARSWKAARAAEHKAAARRSTLPQVTLAAARTSAKATKEAKKAGAPAVQSGPAAGADTVAALSGGTDTTGLSTYLAVCTAEPSLCGMTDTSGTAKYDTAATTPSDTTPATAAGDTTDATPAATAGDTTDTTPAATPGDTTDAASGTVSGDPMAAAAGTSASQPRICVQGGSDTGQSATSDEQDPSQATACGGCHRLPSRTADLTAQVCAPASDTAGSSRDGSSSQDSTSSDDQATGLCLIKDGDGRSQVTRCVPCSIASASGGDANGLTDADGKAVKRLCVTLRRDNSASNSDDSSSDSNHSTDGTKTGQGTQAAARAQTGRDDGAHAGQDAGSDDGARPEHRHGHHDGNRSHDHDTRSDDGARPEHRHGHHDGNRSHDHDTQSDDGARPSDAAQAASDKPTVSDGPGQVPLCPDTARGSYLPCSPCSTARPLASAQGHKMIPLCLLTGATPSSDGYASAGHHATATTSYAAPGATAPYATGADAGVRSSSDDGSSPTGSDAAQAVAQPVMGGAQTYDAQPVR
ncbi:hypothetical protein [Actinoallomurus sp. CA-150999]|uniref:hypothetical protein n=1 Tax=Actinoallomurus sp. CA-150999 TaxID=3239887 RepID=UPI003D94A8DB